MKEKLRHFTQLVLISLLPTLLIWFPFFRHAKTFWDIPLGNGGMATVVANYDGPLYLAVAKTFYNLNYLRTFPFPLPLEYYAAHFPGFPILIKVFAGISGFPYSMLLVTLLTSILAVYFFSKFIGDYVDDKEVMWMTFVFSIFPARWLIVRSVGSPEPLFVAAIIASLYYFKKEKYLASGLWGAVAQITKSPGIILFLAYGGLVASQIIRRSALKKFEDKKLIDLKKTIPLILMPLSLVAVFWLFKIKFNDFWAYFHSGDNIHLFFPPFQIFNYSAPWVGTFWLEEVIFVYLFGVLGFQRLIAKKDSAVAWFVGIFFTSLLFVSHRDIIRYSLPIVPFLIASYSDVIVKKEFKWAVALLLIPIYLFSLAYISQNVMPVTDWSALL